MIRGDRVVLRAWLKNDLEWYAELNNELDYLAITSSDPPAPTSRKYWDEWYEKWSAEQDETTVRFVVEVEGEAVGRCDLFHIDPRERHADLGIGIRPAHQGKGFATDAVRTLARYAFSTLNLERVQLDTLADNSAAIAVYRKVGFVEEGRLREHAWHDGRRRDLVVMGLLRREFEVN